MIRKASDQDTPFRRTEDWQAEGRSRSPAEAGRSIEARLSGPRLTEPG